LQLPVKPFERVTTVPWLWCGRLTTLHLIFLYSKASRPTNPGPNKPRVQGVPASFSVGLKQTGREAEHSRPSIV